MTRLLFSLALLLISLSVSEAQVLFRDDFSGGKSPRWNQRNDGPRPGNFGVQSGSYRIASNDSALSIPRSVVNEGSGGNYYVQADVRVNSGSAKFSSASLISNYIDSNHHYEFSVDPGSRFWSLQKIDKSGLSLLARGNIPAAKNTFRLGLYVREGDLRAFIDNVMVAQQTDARPLGGGAFGLSARGAETFWDNVFVKVSNPEEFAYTINSKTTNQQGIASFGDVTLNVVLEGGQKLSGVTVVRIHRDAVSYFVFIDSLNRSRMRSGFVREFEALQGKEYRVRLKKGGNGFIRSNHSYSVLETDWIFGFLRRSARFVTKGVSTDLKVTRDLHLRSQGFVQPGNVVLNDRALGPAGLKSEANSIVFGRWEEFGNYRGFPTQTGPLSSARAAIAAVESSLGVPGNSKFTLYALRLSSGSASAALSWFVQEDSRAFLITESSELPNEIRPGNSYNIPFTIFNSGEAAGNFRFSVLLSRNGFMGPTDTKLAERTFNGIGPGERLNGEIQAHVPSSIPSGRYFIGTLLETDVRRDRLIRINNLANPIRPITVGDFPSNGQIEVELNWEGSADLDLHVTDPYGETLYYFRPQNQSGGTYQTDRECHNNNGQSEQVVYETGHAAAGLYQISIHYFRPCGESRDIRWNLSVRADNKSENYSGTIRAGEYIRAADFTR